MRYNGMKFKLARGYVFDPEGRIALVRIYIDTEDKPKGDYFLIDIASGLFIIRNKSKNKLITDWENRLLDLVPAIVKQRQTDTYFKRVIELNEEKRIWRNSGYEM